MSYVGNVPTTAAFPFDQFSGNGSTTAFTLSYAPAGTTSIIVSISGVVQNPNTYSVSGTTLTFTPAPPTGTNNIAVLYLGLPVVATLTPGNTAYFSSSVFTATQGQTVFTPSGTYQTGFINVIRNGAQLAPANYTATNGTTVTLANACTAGDIVVIEVFNLTSIAGALPVTGGTVTGATTFNSTLSVNGANVSGFTGFKNRIINPGMVIDQRNNGAALALTNNFGYPVDRFIAVAAATTTITFQQSSIAPAGFTRSLSATMTTPKVLAAADLNRVIHRIEGFNIADLGWGTANAQPVTLSFWVRSSVTGTYTVQFGNGQSYLASYTINAANTWEQKTITIAGSTSGTWPTDNSSGAEINFVLGAGSNWLGTTGAWSGTVTFTVSGAANFIGTAGATFYITGVQLERGSNATSYEFRSIGQELALCQRYYWQLPAGSSFGAGLPFVGAGQAWSTTNTANHTVLFPVTMRVTPTLFQSGLQLYSPNLGAKSATIALGAGQSTVGTTLNTSASTGLTGGNMWYISGVGNATDYVGFGAEL